MIALTQLARSKSLKPIPYPMLSEVMAGIDLNSSTKYFKIAAPVGVHNSPLMSVLYIGMPFSIKAVAGAGTGSIP